MLNISQIMYTRRNNFVFVFRFLKHPICQVDNGLRVETVDKALFLLPSGGQLTCMTPLISSVCDNVVTQSFFVNLDL